MITISNRDFTNITMSIIKLSDSSQVSINLDNATISGNMNNRQLLDIERSKDVSVSATNMRVTDSSSGPAQSYSTGPPRVAISVSMQISESRTLKKNFSLHDTIQDLKTYIRHREPSYERCEFVLVNVRTNEEYWNTHATLKSYGFERQIKLRARQP